MVNRLPDPRGEERRKLAWARRNAATLLAYDRGQPPQPTNPELVTFNGVWPTNYSKGLPHHSDTGLVAKDAFERMVDGINSATPSGMNHPFDVPIGPSCATGQYRPKDYTEKVGAAHFNFVKSNGEDIKVRNWESPRAGHVFDLIGPDAGALAVSSFPELGSHELNAEMAELFAMAYLRDTDVIAFEQGAAHDAKIGIALKALNTLPWFKPAPGTLTDAEKRRYEARFIEPDAPTPAPPGLTAANLFRGSAPGAKTGPFVSQFLLIGNEGRGVAGTASTIADGYIEWGAQRIDQRLSVHEEGVDWLTDWPSWLDAQNGADFKGLDRYENGGKPRFITTLRDLATYVHFDALYQAYLNAYLILTSLKVDFEAGFPSGSAHPTRGSFATFGAPHFQTLLTEVSSRALKVVRRQKFQWQLRGRPEYLGGMLAVAGDPALASKLGPAQGQMMDTLNALKGAGVYDAFAFPGQKMPPPGLSLNTKHVKAPPAGPAGCKLLPMAFPEGSPMHPSYGAGHATVAGACVTMIKAVLKLHVKKPGSATTDPFTTPDLAHPDWWYKKLTLADLKLPCVYHPPARGNDRLVPAPGSEPGDITVIGELNKLAANISIARNIAGVHYYTDYYASLRLGERVAVGMLEEQLLMYIEPMAMRFESFDGDHIVLSTTGDGMTVTKQAFDADHKPIDYASWWSRHFVD